MKKLHILMSVLVAVLLCSCNTQDIPTQSLGEVSYYPSFLCWDADTVSLTKVFELDFNQDAKDEGVKTTAEFAFVDNDGKVVDPKELEIKVNGVVAKDNKFTVDATQENVELTFTFLPAAESGKHQGNFRMVKHSLLDRVDNQIIEDSSAIDVFKWTIYFEKNMNPLLVGLIWLGAIILFVLFVWFAFLQPTHFKKFRKSVLVAKNGKNIEQFNCDFSGCWKVVFASQKVKQSRIDRIFNGEIKTIIRPSFAQPLVFVAKKRGKTRIAWATGSGYNVQSNPIPQSGRTEIIHSSEKLKITLTT